MRKQVGPVRLATSSLPTRDGTVHISEVGEHGRSAVDREGGREHRDMGREQGGRRAESADSEIAGWVFGLLQPQPPRGRVQGQVGSDTGREGKHQQALLRTLAGSLLH